MPAAPDLKTVVPFFQPIIKSSDCEVFAYEVLAREERDGRVRSLGPYFEDPSVSDEDKLILDKHVRERALAAYAASGSTAKLFINLKPSWIYADKEHRGKQSILAMLERYKIDPQNIVIEVTEEEALGDKDLFRGILAGYREAGCMLAIDDFGKGASSVERIAYVTPDIIKMDHSIVRKTDTHRSFYEICSAMSAFGTISGFDLLFEGVETAFQLERCIKTGWCYLQGFLFSQARPDLATDYANRDLLSDIVFIENARASWNIKHRNAIRTEMESAVEKLRPMIPMEENALREAPALCNFAQALPWYCVRCFICDHRGRRISPVYLSEEQVTAVLPGRAAGPDLPHELFARGLDAFHNERQGYLSSPYKHVTTKENIMSYMHTLREDRVLCADLMTTILF